MLSHWNCYIHFDLIALCWFLPFPLQSLMNYCFQEVPISIDVSSIYPVDQLYLVNYSFCRKPCSLCWRNTLCALLIPLRESQFVLILFWTEPIFLFLDFDLGGLPFPHLFNTLPKTFGPKLISKDHRSSLFIWGIKDCMIEKVCLVDDGGYSILYWVHITFSDLMIYFKSLTISISFWTLLSYVTSSTSPTFYYGSSIMRSESYPYWSSFEWEQ